MLVLCVLGLLAEGWWVEKRVFFVFYEPHITPMSYWGTRLESVAYTPVANGCTLMAPCGHNREQAPFDQRLLKPEKAWRTIFAAINDRFQSGPGIQQKLTFLQVRQIAEFLKGKGGRGGRPRVPFLRPS